jgi:CRAL/TRIO, N-terminal domain
MTLFYAWCVFCILKGFLCTEDEFLLRFLNARKFKIEASFNLLVNYYLYRQRQRHLFIGLNVQDPLIKRALFDGIPGVLPQVDIFFKLPTLAL